jgi:hypothetical protein
LRTLWTEQLVARDYEKENMNDAPPMPDPNNAGKPSTVCLGNPTCLGWMKWPWDNGKRTCPQGMYFIFRTFVPYDEDHQNSLCFAPYLSGMMGKITADGCSAL